MHRVVRAAARGTNGMTDTVWVLPDDDGSKLGYRNLVFRAVLGGRDAASLSR
jgi:hypothetical protein